jgi:RHS repeat-associated protein
MSRLKRLKDVSSTATLFDRQYGYNSASQISQITEPTLTRTIGYDFVNRLTSVTASNGQNESYQFDDVGNRLSSHRLASYGYQPFNKIISTATGIYGYDANGNMVSKAEGMNFWRYGFDYENRLVSASTRKQTVRYRYDALGRRVQRFTVGGRENTKFIYDGQDVLVDDNGGTLTKYINGSGIDNKLRQQTGNDVKYFLGDHLGSTNGLTDTSGNLTSSTNYDAFGNATNANFPNRHQFTGREFDDFTGLHYYRARFYDGNLGRFISEDPIGFAGGDVNLYGYVWNNPQNWVDPSGKIPVVIPVIIGIGILIATSPSYVNAPAPGDQIYYPENQLFLNAAGGPVCSFLFKRFASPLLNKIIGGMGDDIIELGISQGPTRTIGNTSKGFYAPNSPLPQQNVGGVDIPTPLPQAQGPHTVLGTRVGSDGIPYRQSATFPGETFPKANGQNVPWSRVDWTNHGRGDHLFPHQHPFLLQNNGKWKIGSQMPF